MDKALETLCKLLQSAVVGATIADVRPAMVLRKKKLSPVFANASGVRQQGVRNVRELSEIDQSSLHLPSAVVARLHRFAASATSGQRQSELVQVPSETSRISTKVLEKLELTDLGLINGDDLMLVILASRAEELHHADVYGLKHWVSEDQFVMLFDIDGEPIASVGDHTLLDTILQKVQAFVDEDNQEPLRVRRIKTSDGDRDVAVIALAGGPERILLISRVPCPAVKTRLNVWCSEDSNGVSASLGRLRAGAVGIKAVSSGEEMDAVYAKSFVYSGNGTLNLHKDETSSRVIKNCFGNKKHSTVIPVCLNNDRAVSASCDSFVNSQVVNLPSAAQRTRSDTQLGSTGKYGLQNIVFPERKDLHREPEKRTLSSVPDVVVAAASLDRAVTRPEPAIHRNVIADSVGTASSTVSLGKAGETSGLLDLSVLLDKLDTPFIITDFEKILYVNQTFLELFGYSDLNSFEMHGGLSCLFSDKIDLSVDGFDKFAKLSTSAGDTVDANVCLNSIPWNGSFAVLLSLKVVGETVLAERTEKASSAFNRVNERLDSLELVFDSVIDCIFIFDANKRIASVNKSACGVLNIGRDKLIGLSVNELFAPVSRSVIAGYLERLAEQPGGGGWKASDTGISVILQVDDLVRLPMQLVSASGICSKQLFCVVLQRPVPSRQNLDTVKLDAFGSEIIAKVHREICGPLDAILSFSEKMLNEGYSRESDSHEPYKEYVTDVHAYGMQIKSIVNDLLALSRISVGEVKLNFEVISLSSLTAECVSIVQGFASKRRVIVRTSFAGLAPSVVADVNSLRRIILSLLSNAVAHTKVGGQVIISLAKEETGDVSIRIKDVGTNATGSEIESSVDFQQEVATLSGLGLELTKALVESNYASFRTCYGASGEGLVSIAFPFDRVVA